jgi:hypothetical protein
MLLDKKKIKTKTGLPWVKGSTIEAILSVIFTMIY